VYYKIYFYAADATLA